MSSKTVTKHKPKSHPKGWLFCLAAALVVSLLALRAKRRRIRFAFAARSCRGAFHMRPKTSHIQNGRIWNPPLRSRLERANHGAKRSYPSAQNGQSRTPVPTIELSMRIPAPISRTPLQSPRFYDILITERR